MAAKISLLLLLAICGAAHAISISNLALRLPCTTLPAARVWHDLHTTGGCFTWETSKPAVVSISPLPGSRCPAGSSTSARVMVSAVDDSSHCEFSRNAWIIGREVQSNQAVSCEVFVSQLRRLEILTTTHIVHAGDRQSVVLQAFDEDGNVFDTMRALPFRWQILDAHTDHVLSKIKFADSNMAGVDEYAQLESKGITSDRLAIEGLKCGVTNISATLLDHSHPSMSAMAQITVVEPISLLPTGLIAMACAEYQLQLFVGRYETSKASSDAESVHRSHFSQSPLHLSAGVPLAVALPSTHYTFNSSDPKTVFVHSREGLLLTNHLPSGSSRAVAAIRVFDSRLPDNTPWKGAQETVEVTTPSLLRMAVIKSRPARPSSPQAELMTMRTSPWSLSTHVQYVLRVEIIDQLNRTMTVPRNLEISLTASENIVRIRRLNATFFQVSGDSLGIDTLSAALTRMVSNHSLRAGSITAGGCIEDFNLLSTQSIRIVAPVRLVYATPLAAQTPVNDNTTLRLPWNGAKEHYPVIRLQALHGSGNFRWHFVYGSTASEASACSRSSPCLELASQAPASALSVDIEAPPSESDKNAQVFHWVSGIAFGEQFVYVADIDNEENAAWARVEVRPSSQLTILPGAREVPMGSSLPLGLRLVALANAPAFTLCDRMPLTRSLNAVHGADKSVTVAEPGFQLSSAPLCQMHCAPEAFAAVASSQKVDIDGLVQTHCWTGWSLEVSPTQAPRWAELQTSITFTSVAFAAAERAGVLPSRAKTAASLISLNKLDVTVHSFHSLHAEPAEVLVAAQFSNIARYLEGPMIWAHQNEKYGSDSQIIAVKSENENLKSNLEYSVDHAQKLMKLQCLQPHEQSLKVCVTNRPLDRNPLPVTSCSTFVLRCVAPLLPSSALVQIGVGRALNMAVLPHVLAADNVTWSVIGAGSAHVSVDSVSGVLRSSSLGRAMITARVTHPSLAHTPMSASRTLDGNGLESSLQSLEIGNGGGSTVEGLLARIVATSLIEDFVIVPQNSVELLPCRQASVSLVSTFGDSAADASFDDVSVEWSSSDSTRLITLPTLAQWAELEQQAAQDTKALSAAAQSDIVAAMGVNKAAADIVASYRTAAAQCGVALAALFGSGVDEVSAVRSASRSAGPSIRVLALPSATIGAAPLSVHARVVASRPLPVRVFSRSINVSIRPLLQLRSPSNMLLPPGAEFRVQTSLSASQLQFEALTTAAHKETLVSIDKNGLITAGNVAGSSVVHISTDSSIGSTQTASVHVQVEEPSSLGLLTQSGLQVGLPCLMCGDTRLGAVVEPSTVSKPTVATATSLDQAAPLRMCAGSNHSIHVAVRDRLGRTFSSLSRWFVRSNATDKGTAATSLLSALVHMPGAVSGAPTNVVTVRQSTVDPDGEYGPILGSFDIVANRPGRVALCVYLAHPQFTASAPATAAVPLDNVQSSHEISAVARCAPSFDSHLQPLYLAIDVLPACRPLRFARVRVHANFDFSSFTELENEVRLQLEASLARELVKVLVPTLGHAGSSTGSGDNTMRLALVGMHSGGFEFWTQAAEVGALESSEQAREARLLRPLRAHLAAAQAAALAQSERPSSSFVDCWASNASFSRVEFVGFVGETPVSEPFYSEAFGSAAKSARPAVDGELESNDFISYIVALVCVVIGTVALFGRGAAQPQAADDAFGSQFDAPGPQPGDRYADFRSPPPKQRAF